MDTATFLQSLKEKMQKTLEVIKNDVNTVRTGRATPALVEHIKVSAYDGTAQMSVAEMGTISVADPKTMVIAPFDPSQIKAIEHAILEANTGINPVIDGHVIRLTIPSLTEERRQEYIKLAKAKIEGGKVMVRQIRHDAMSDVKKASEKEELNEDQQELLEKQIQDVVDKSMDSVDELWNKKEAELLQV